jgi:hypothetical protein
MEAIQCESNYFAVEQKAGPEGVKLWQIESGVGFS